MFLPFAPARYKRRTCQRRGSKNTTASAREAAARRRILFTWCRLFDVSEITRIEGIEGSRGRGQGEDRHLVRRLRTSMQRADAHPPATSCATSAALPLTRPPALTQQMVGAVAADRGHDWEHVQHHGDGPPRCFGYAPTVAVETYPRTPMALQQVCRHSAKRNRHEIPRAWAGAWRPVCNE